MFGSCMQFGPGGTYYIEQRRLVTQPFPQHLGPFKFQCPRCFWYRASFDEVCPKCHPPGGFLCLICHTRSNVSGECIRCKMIVLPPIPKFPPVSVAHPAGPVYVPPSRRPIRVVDAPPDFKEAPPKVQAPAPRLGRDTPETSPQVSPIVLEPPTPIDWEVEEPYTWGEWTPACPKERAREHVAQHIAQNL
jgi:hypothetical protein